MQQTTIKQACTFSGIGLHSGINVHCTARPAPANTGIIFDIHTATGTQRLQPTPQAVSATALATTLSAHDGKHAVQLSTVEHLLASIRALSIDNILIDVYGTEIPIMDGSAKEFVHGLKKAGIHTLHAPRCVFRVARPIMLSNGNKILRAKPYKGFRVSYTIDFPHPLIGKQSLSLDINPSTFEQLMSARTFGFLKDIEALRSMKLVLGGSLDNAIVLDDKAVLNAEGLRSPDEFVRHKILDFIGDMAVLQLPLQGAFDISCSGHQLNNLFLRKLVYEDALTLVDLADEERAKPPRQVNYARAPAAFALA